MGVINWMVRLASKFIPHPMGMMVGLARKVLRAIISGATKMNESLPDIKRTMRKIDPDKVFTDWSEKYRTGMQGISLQKRLATWPKQLRFDESVMTSEHMKRAKKYRYIFTMDTIDIEGEHTGLKMYSMYSNKLLSPQEVVDEFFDRDYLGTTKDVISYGEYSFYRLLVNVS